MKTIQFSISVFILAMILIFASGCSKKDAPAPDDTRKGVFSIEFDNIVGDETLGFDPRTYKNAKGETFRIKILRYYISNIKLYKADGSEYVVPQEQSYFFIEGSDKTSRFAKVDVPEGDYTRVKFIIGVDSARSTMPTEARQGVLSFNPDEGHDGMYWGWNQGYIFFKLEGYCNAISDDQQGDPTGNKQFKYHIGGYGGYNPKAPTLNNIKEITMDLNQAGIAQVREGLRSNVHLFLDVMKVFNGPYTFSIVQHPNVMFSEFSQNIANNFTSMFTHDHTENFVKSESEL